MDEQEFNSLINNGSIKTEEVKPSDNSVDSLDKNNEIESYIPELNAIRRLKQDSDSVPTYTPKNFIDQFYLYLSGSTRIFYVWINKGWLALEAFAGLNNVVEDTTPQLGGDLDLNGKAIDFPSTANIVDCHDEDDMASNDALGLATQQSIKAYVDNSIPAQGSYVLAADMTTNSATISGTGVHQIVAYQIPAGLLGTTAGIRVRCILYTDAASWTGNIDLELGTTAVTHEVANHTIIRSSGDNSMRWDLDFVFYNQSSASAQQFAGHVLQNDNTTTILNGYSLTENTGNAINIRITATRSSGSETGVLATAFFLVEYLPAP